MAAYEVTCAKHGIHIVWRPLVPECQQTCDLGMEFTPCAAQDERACQGLTYAPILEVSKPFVDICVGGCVCENDKYLDVNGVCKEIEQCQCFWKGQYLNAGDIKFDNIQEVPVNTVSYSTLYHTSTPPTSNLYLIFRPFSVNIRVINPIALLESSSPIFLLLQLVAYLMITFISKPGNSRSMLRSVFILFLYLLVTLLANAIDF